MDDAWQHVIFAILALLAMCIAALVQSVLGMMGEARLRQVWKDESTRGRSVQSLFDPRRLLSASMVLLQVVMAILATGQLMPVLNDWVAVVVVVVAYVVFGIALPRALAMTATDSLLQRVLQLGKLAALLLSPVERVIGRLTRIFAEALPGEIQDIDESDHDQDLRPRRAERHERAAGPGEQEMIDGIYSLADLTVRDIMVPRLDIIAVDRTINPRELIDTIVKAGHSRIPVYQESVDRIIGVLYAKDLLPFVIGNTIRIPLLDLIRPAFVVPESKRLNVLFAELRRTRIHLAIVADEYGGTAGLVTIEDVLEEIVGEIQDEYDPDEWLFDQPSPDQLIADGRLPIEDVEDALKIEFDEDDDFGTLGGFVHKHLGRLPVQGDAFEAEGVKVDILAVERHRIRRLRLTTLLPSEPEDEKQPERSSRWGRGDSTDQSDQPGALDDSEK